MSLPFVTVNETHIQEAGEAQPFRDARAMRPKGLAALVCSVSLLLQSSCAPRDVQGLCRSQGECDKDNACIVGRCRPRAEPAIATTSRRVVLEPTEIAVLSSRQQERVDLPAIGFGRGSSGDVVMLLSFDDALGSEVELESAFLVLEPATGSPTPFSAVPIQIAAIREEWSPSTVSWARQPALALAETAIDATPRARTSLRIDVTRIIGSVRERHGIAVLASGHDPIGAFYATGLGSGVAPRLELYLKSPKHPPAAASASAAPSASAVPSGAASADAASADDPSALDDAPPTAATARPKTPSPKRPKKFPFVR